MASKFCSTAALDAFFTSLYTFNGNGRIVIMTSSDGGGVGDITIAGCSCNSTGCIAWGPTSTDGMSTSYFTIGSSGNNRYCTIGACSCDTVINTNDASQVCLIDDSSSVRYYTTCTTQRLTSGNKVNIGSWTITINQPT